MTGEIAFSFLLGLETADSVIYTKPEYLKG